MEFARILANTLKNGGGGRERPPDRAEKKKSNGGVDTEGNDRDRWETDLSQELTMGDLSALIQA